LGFLTKETILEPSVKELLAYRDYQKSRLRPAQHEIRRLMAKGQAGEILADALTFARSSRPSLRQPAAVPTAASAGAAPARSQGQQ